MFVFRKSSCSMPNMAWLKGWRVMKDLLPGRLAKAGRRLGAGRGPQGCCLQGAGWGKAGVSRGAACGQGSLLLHLTPFSQVPFVKISTVAP